MPQGLLPRYEQRTEPVCDGEGVQTVERRKEKGRLLAQDKRLKHIEGAIWFVPSQTKNSGGYIVDFASQTCTCPSFELIGAGGSRCKHLWAVELKLAETETAQQTPTLRAAKIPRKAYPQDPSYSEAQCNEKHLAQKLLRGLCDGILSPPHPGRGPKPIALSDIVFSAVMKCFVNMSGRRATSDLRACLDAGHLARVPRFNTLFEHLGGSELTPLLMRLLEESAKPLASVETHFAADSTCFGTSVYRRWFDVKYGREMREHRWIKAHVVIGTKTHIVTSATITEGTAHDSPALRGLLTATARSFKTIERVSADKGYLSHDNLAAIESLGAVPYIPLKSSSKPEGPAAWRRLWGLFLVRHEEFKRFYHKRSNVEAAFSAIKRKFGHALRSKVFVAQTNETICRLLAWNLSCLVHAIYELGIEPEFGVVTPMPEQTP